MCLRLCFFSCAQRVFSRDRPAVALISHAPRMFPVGSSDLDNMLVSVVPPCLCSPMKPRCARVYVRECMQRSVYWVVVVVGGVLSALSVCLCACLISLHAWPESVYQCISASVWCLCSVCRLWGPSLPSARAFDVSVLCLCIVAALH